MLPTRSRAPKPQWDQAPSGWRNSHLACTYAHPGGPHALLAWATTWAQGDVPPYGPHPSGQAHWPYLFWETAEQRTVRPLVCTEALVKLAFGIVATSAEAQIEVAAGPY